MGARPTYRRQGLTRALLLGGLCRMQAQGMDRACISTGDSNTPALRLYEPLGFRAATKVLDYIKKAAEIT